MKKITKDEIVTEATKLNSNIPTTVVEKISELLSTQLNSSELNAGSVRQISEDLLKIQFEATHNED